MDFVYAYWGKAGKEDQGCHLLVYHCLDVAAVARHWLQASTVITKHFSDIAMAPPRQVMGWVLFFMALHDLGKFDIRFQMKVERLWRELCGDEELSQPLSSISRDYWHGEYAAYWLFEDLADRFEWKADEYLWEEPKGEAVWDAWQPWIRAVAGHHGKEPPQQAIPNGTPPMVDAAIREQEQAARMAFIEAMETLFLKPAGLSLNDLPPPCDLEFLAGFCSVCDWLGSMTENATGQPRFTFISKQQDLGVYFESRLPIAQQVLEESGLLGRVMTDGGMTNLYPKYTPRQVQTLVGGLPLDAGLTLIEAPTGSGKTEAALAYAARLLAAGKADSIIFALPTQATADAMLERLEEVAPRLFDSANVVLAHGKSLFNPRFIDLKKKADSAQSWSAREQEAGAQCAFWLAQSRKRVFLGQIGVCTVDQVLISALPVRHRFVRGFGIGRSVLIIDEIHAYDAYMYQLLDKVLRHQHAIGGSAILLSATLPLKLRRALLESWSADADALTEKDTYPRITCANAQGVRFFELPPAEAQRLEEEQSRTIQIAWQESSNMLPDETLENDIVKAVQAGANVALICNLVADAQALYERLRTIGVDASLFHSRYRFDDRQRIQETVMQRWGKEGKRENGGVLVATQVIEQSLDLDFDWMITQLCPIDLLFQRLGRLHRHERKRPDGFWQPYCTVLLPENRQYELHKLIYGNGKTPNERVLWRTEQVIRQNPEMRFPKAYRPLIEKVYREDAWPDEPEDIVEGYEQFWQAEYASRMSARQMSDTDADWAWNDDDDRVTALTRDGEMSLNIVPVTEDEQGRRCFLGDDRPIAGFPESEQAERIMRNTLPAPASWRGLGLPEASPQDGLIWLVVQPDGQNQWIHDSGKARFVYNPDTGMRMEKT